MRTTAMLVVVFGLAVVGGLWIRNLLAPAADESRGESGERVPGTEDSLPAGKVTDAERELYARQLRGIVEAGSRWGNSRAHHLQTLARGEPWEQRADAARALGLITPMDRIVVDALGRALGDPHGRVRRAAVLALGNAGPEAPAAIAQLSILLDPDADPGLVMIPAIHMLARLGRPEAVAAVTGMLRHRRADVREEAAMALGDLGPRARSAAPALREMLRDPVDRARRAAMDALRRVLAPADPPGKER